MAGKPADVPAGQSPTSVPATSRNLSDDVLDSINEAQQDVSLNSENFWGLALRFRSPPVERRYQEEALRAKLRHDVQVHIHGLVPGWLLAFRHWHSLSWLGAATIMTVSLVTAPAALHASLRKPSFYRRFRTPILMIAHLHSMLMFNFLAQEEHPEAPTPLSLLGSILFKSPATVAVYFSMNGNLPLPHNLALQCLAAPLHLKWTSDFCGALGGCGARIGQALGDLGMMIKLLAAILPNMVVGEGNFSCSLIVGSIVFFLGVLAPIAVAYNLDLVRRKAFVSRNFPSRLTVAFEQSISDSQAAIWYLVVAIQSIWTIFFLF